MGKKILLLFVLNFFIVSVSAQSYKIEFILEDIKYDSITLKGHCIDSKTFSIPGIIDTVNSSYKFEMPDSLCTKMTNYTLDTGYDEKDNTLYTTELLTVKDGDTLTLRHFVYDPHITSIHAKYIGSKTIKNVYIKKGLGALHFDSFLITYPSGTEWDIQLQHPIFSFFYPQKAEEEYYTYQDFLSQYESAVKKYPSSNYLLSFVCYAGDKYQSKKDLERVFYSFSDSIRKKTIWGDSITHFLETYPSKTEFTNDKLSDCNTGEEELIVRDTSKFNLVIFSATWCAPCHAQIPLLKEIYNRLSPMLEMTYISLDTMSQVVNWRKLMKEKEIPWRSLLAGERMASVRARYFAYSIPRSLLVYPGGRKMEIIDVRKKEDKAKLFMLVQTQGNR